MRRRVGPRLYSILGLLAVSLTAQAQSVTDGTRLAEPAQRTITDGSVEDLSTPGEIQPVNHCTSCTFADTVSSYDEASCSSKCGPMTEYKAHCRGLPTLKGLCGKGRLGSGDNSACDSAACSSCYAGWDIEKRIYAGYVYGGASGISTKVAVGNINGAQVGAEFLPLVLQDGSTVFSRLGFTVMWQYSALSGGVGGAGQIQSRLSGGRISTSGGEMNSIILAPTFRLDYEILGIRLSPNSTMGLTLDWINMTPTNPAGGTTRTVDTFHFTGFDAGYYGKWAFDIGLSEKINFSIGMDYRSSATAVLQQNNDWRNHLGIVIGMSHTF